MAKLKEKPVEKPLPNSAAKHLRVLFIEDSEDDMMLELIELQQAGYTVDSVRVQDAAALENALQDTWDLILSDYNMPSFTGMDALQIIQKKNIDIPFILVSGVIGEIAAVNLMKAGAKDYILKDRMVRLVPAVERELKEARERFEKREAQQALKYEQDYSAQLIANAPAIILVLDAKGIIQHVNPYFEKLTGYTLNEIEGKEWFATFLPERDRDRVRKVFISSLAGDSTRGNTNPILTREGKEREIEWFDNVIKNNQGEITQLIAFGLDITERHKAEKIERQANQHLKNILDGMYAFVGLYSTEGILLEANRAPLEAAGIQREDVIGKPFWEAYWWSYSVESQQQIRNTLMRAAQGHIVRDDFKVRLADDHFMIMDGMFGPLYDEAGNVTQIVGSGVDITERKKAEEAQRTSTLQLAEAQTIGHMGNWNWDIQTNTLHWSDEIYRIFGLQRQSSDANYNDFMNSIHPDDRELVQTAIDNALHNTQPYSIDHRIRLPDGSIRFVHEQGEVRFDENGDPLRMIGTVQDITERKIAEQMLHKSENRFRATFEQAAVGIAHVGMDGSWLKVNNRLCEIVGYTQTDLLKLTFQDITHPDDLHSDLTLVNELVTGTRDNYSMEKRYFNKDGDITWIQLTVALVRDRNNKPEYFIKVVEDINDRKAAEARIQTTLEEKDIVLRELHHRVKNNMQVISSLLSLQARYANISNPQEALQESRQRIRAMAMIHERLYGSDDLASVDFLDYLRYLAERLSRIYHNIDSDIKIQVSGEPLQIPIDHALPCALISNELITNTIKHAYQPDQAERLLEIRIANVSSSQAQIIFRDYGQGIDTTLVNSSPNTLGLVIVNALTRQLGGTIELESLNGTTATLTFPLTSTYNNRLK